ncbi:MAG: maltose ABC transporter permease MalF [Burkholderiaceae bacterium]|nr:maltose ABC transporter permease MalF [Burkholderiaceae bacterium]
MIGRVVAGSAVLALLWLVYATHMAGQAVAAVALLVLGGSALWVYAGARSLAWKYLYPGVVGMLVFVAFPLLYTVQIGFTNYSSNHLLTEARARAYLLDQHGFDEARLHAFTLHAGDRVLLTAPDGARWTTLLGGDGALQAASGDLGPALPMRDVIARRDALMALQPRLPDGTTLAYAGLREYGVKTPDWRAAPEGALQEVATGAVYAARRDTGYFTGPEGQTLQPGFTVGVGFANYQRMLLDSDFRGPFVSIFVWTVTFSALTVLFATVIGMALAVALEWPALKGRAAYRTLLFLPYAVPGFISILVFKGLFNQNFGEINAILDALLGVRPAWFADPTLARTMLLIVNTWLGYPYIMILCTGLLKSVPSDLYEASALAGASPWVNFSKITAPLIIKPLTPLLISAFAFNFNNFVLISLLTDGRPDYLNTKLPAGTTDILVSYTYRIAFTDAGANFGLAAAISTLIFAMVALMALVQLRMTKAGAAK